MWIFYAFIFVFLVCPIIVWIGITLAVSFPIILVLSPVFLAICYTFFWIFVVPPILIGGNLIAFGYGVLYGWVLIQKTLLSRSFRGRTCEIIMSEYYYRQMLRKVEALGYSTEALHSRLRQAVTTGQFLSEYDNGIIVFKPNSAWRMIRNQITRRRYSSARGGLRIVGKRTGLINNVQIIKLEESFDEGIPAERQEYQNFLRREAKGVTYLTHQMGYRHGRPLDISLDEDRSNRNYRPIYQ